MTHAVEGLRRAFLSGAAPLDLLDHALPMMAWAAVSFVLAFVVLRQVMKALSREGSFGAY